jgi:hypothetical protein
VRPQRGSGHDPARRPTLPPTATQRNAHRLSASQTDAAEISVQDPDVLAMDAAAIAANFRLMSSTPARSNHDDDDDDDAPPLRTALLHRSYDSGAVRRRTRCSRSRCLLGVACTIRDEAMGHPLVGRRAANVAPRRGSPRMWAAAPWRSRLSTSGRCGRRSAFTRRTTARRRRASTTPGDACSLLP